MTKRDRELEAGATAHFEDPDYYAITYATRKEDVAFYTRVAAKHDRVLEYGIGNGRIALPIARHGIDITGIDHSRPMLADLRQRLKAESKLVRGRVTPVFGDMRTTRLRKRFPLVIATFNTALHLYERPDVEAFLACVRSHLTARGTFVVDMSVPPHAWGREVRGALRLRSREADLVRLDELLPDRRAGTGVHDAARTQAILPEGVGGALALQRLRGDAPLRGLPRRPIRSHERGDGVALQGATVSELVVRLDQVRARIESAARACGRDPALVKLVAVSKTHAAAAIRDAYSAGQRAFGESYAQELADKAAQLSDLRDLEWHFIGHLQSNKAKVIAKHASAVHAVDGASLARELGKRAANESREMDILVEVKLSHEPTKHGARPEELEPVLAAVEREPSLRLRGLMTVPPADDLALARSAFSTLASLRNLHGGVTRLPELSMGMTADLEIAIACGATLVRVGTAIFGDR